MGNKFLKFIFRLFVGGIVWAVIGVLALLSAVPYGGGSKGLIGLFQLATIVVLIWAFMAFFSEDSSGSLNEDDQFREEKGIEKELVQQELQKYREQLENVTDAKKR